MRQEFELSVEQRDFVLKASAPTPAMYLSGGTPMYATPQENANSAWQEVAKDLGFKWDTARPVPGKSDRFITAEVVEEQRPDRQTLLLDTVVGQVKLAAPSGWAFDKTAITAWAALLQLTRELLVPQQTLRDKRVKEGQIGMLANVLANALGMATPYWAGAALDIVTEERAKP